MVALRVKRVTVAATVALVLKLQLTKNPINLRKCKILYP